MLGPSAIGRALRLALACVTLACVWLASGCGGGKPALEDVIIQLDARPNAAHIGMYVALAKGWYKQAGIQVRITEFTLASPEEAVANEQADLGFSSAPALITARAAGVDAISVASVVQHSLRALAVLTSSDLERPRDFDDQVYAGHDLPYRDAAARAIVRSDGGQGNFSTAKVSTAAMQSLVERRADFTDISLAAEGIDAELKGLKLRTFRYDKYALPDYASVVLVGKPSTLTKKEALLRRFLEVTRRGYELSAQQPQPNFALYEKSLRRGSFVEPEAVRRAVVMLAPSFLAADGRWGAQDASQWGAYARWLVDEGVLRDAKGALLRAEPSGGPLFTNALLAR